MTRHPLASPRLLLTGPMGAGKTTVGRLAAEAAGATFADLDARVVEGAGRSVAEIFATEGEAGFRRRERAALESLLASGAAQVIALGGGALLDATFRRRALEDACVVGLTASPRTLLERTRGSSRPLLGPEGDRSEVLDTILAARRESYAEAHATLPTDDAPPAALSQRVLEVWRRPMIAVPLGARTYAVELAAEDGLALGRTVAAHARSAVFVVSDRNVEPLWGDALRASLRANGIEAKATIAVPPGEGEKHLGTVEAVLRALVEAGADRDALVVGHGGGVVTDIAGFCAATLLRGVPWVAAPTTLLGMVDAAVGGKTGVDLGAAKNAVGAFHQPKGVVVDMSRAATESPRGFRSGLAEVVKAASIADAALFEALERQVEALRRRERTAAELAAWGALRVKAAIVGRDEHEAGERAVLNFGHTIGHALEMQGGLGRLTHGEAVALGMIAALRVGERLGVTPRGVVERVVGLLDALGLPTNLDAEDLAAALPAVAFDKKRRGGSIRFVLLRAIGATELCWVEPSALAALVSPAATA